LAQGEVRDLIAISNTGDNSVTLIDSATDTIAKTIPVGSNFSFGANKHFKTTGLIWTGLLADQSKEIQVIDLGQGKVIQKIATNSTQNYTETTPDGRFAISANRFTDTYFKIGADPSKPNFGEVVAQLKSYNNAGPCDITLSPDGKYAYSPDRHSDNLSVIDLADLKVLATVPVPRVVARSDQKVEPFMATASRDGRWVFVENVEPPSGTESIFDVSNPLKPREITRLLSSDGLGKGPISDEFTFDGQFNFIINRDSATINVVDMKSFKIVNAIELVRGGNPITGDFSIDGRKFYVPIQNQNTVVVVDVAEQKVVKTIAVGPRPAGAIALRTAVPSIAGVALGSLPIVNPGGDSCLLPCCGSS
jgi:YVTN family beta-propeller protein